MCGTQSDKDKETLDGPIRAPLYNVGNKIMGFAIHYPVSGIVKGMNWNVVNLEWEYYIENGEGYDGKIKEGKILRFDDAVWMIVSGKWNRYLELMKEAYEIESSVRKMISHETKKEEGCEDCDK